MRDRDSLRAEVTDMRKSLEEIQSKHRADMEALQQKVDDAESKRGQAETQYQKLLERVNTIKSQLGERLKEDAVCSAGSVCLVFWLIVVLTLFLVFIGGAHPSKISDRRTRRAEFEHEDRIGF